MTTSHLARDTTRYTACIDGASDERLEANAARTSLPHFHHQEFASTRIVAHTKSYLPSFLF